MWQVRHAAQDAGVDMALRPIGSPTTVRSPEQVAAIERSSKPRRPGQVRPPRLPRLGLGRPRGAA